MVFTSIWLPRRTMTLTSGSGSGAASTGAGASSSTTPSRALRSSTPASLLESAPKPRSDSDRLPTVEASVSACTCSGVPCTVTVRAILASIRSGSVSWSTATISMFWIRIRAVGPALRSLVVRMMSTRLPGSRKPPTAEAASTGRV